MKIIESHFKRSKHPESIMMNIAGYTMFRRDRPKRAKHRGGGVAIYLRDNTVARKVLASNCNPAYKLLRVSVQSANYNIIIGALYHPPKPIYQTPALLEHIEACVDQITTDTSDSMIVLAGNVNGLSENELVTRTGLSPIVNQATRGANCLDRIYVSEPCYSDIKVVQSAVTSDHRAVIAYTGTIEVTYNKVNTKRIFRKQSPESRHTHSVLISAEPTAIPIRLHRRHSDRIRPFL